LWRYVKDDGGVLSLRMGFERHHLPDGTSVPFGVPEWRVGGLGEARVRLTGTRAGRVDGRVRTALQRVLGFNYGRGDSRWAGLLDAGVEASF
jgi:hypothetical protein